MAVEAGYGAVEVYYMSGLWKERKRVLGIFFLKGGGLVL